MVRGVENDILFDGWALLPGTETQRDAASELLPAGLAVVEAWKAVRETDEYQALRDHRRYRNGHVSLTEGDGTLVFESLWPQSDTATGYSRIGYSTALINVSPVVPEAKSTGLRYDLYDLRHELAKLGTRALTHLGIETPSPWYDQEGHLWSQSWESIRIMLAHYPPGANLPTSDSSQWSEGHRDAVREGAVLSWQLSPEPRTWRLGSETYTAERNQDQGDVIWLDSRTNRTCNPNPYHAVRNPAITDGISLLFSAKGTTTRHFDQAFDKQLAA